MKLERHREDVKYVELIAAALPVDNLIRLTKVARRYLNLIRMAEEGLNILGPITKCRTKREQRVLKDAGLDK